MAQLPLIRQNQAGNAHIDGATPSYLPTSINQPTVSKYATSIRVIPRQDAKPPGKTSELSFLGHRWCNFRHFASKGRDALKPNFNKWPEEPFLDGKNGSSGHLLKLGLKASRPLLAQNNFRHFAKIRLGHRWRNSGSCAIYVPKKQLDVERKLWGETSAEDCKKICHF